MMLNSTAFAADFRYAETRACMEGDEAGYFDNLPVTNGHSYRSDYASGNAQTMLWDVSARITRADGTTATPAQGQSITSTTSKPSCPRRNGKRSGPASTGLTKKVNRGAGRIK